MLTANSQILRNCASIDIACEKASKKTHKKTRSTKMLPTHNESTMFDPIQHRRVATAVVCGSLFEICRSGAFESRLLKDRQSTAGCIPNPVHFQSKWFVVPWQASARLPAVASECPSRDLSNGIGGENVLMCIGKQLR